MATADSEFVSDVWDTMVSYIPAKEKLAAAEALIKLCDEFGFTKEDLYDMVDDNNILETAFGRYFADDMEDEDDWG